MPEEAREIPVVEAVLAVEPLPAGANGSRRAMVRWSDGAEGEACHWFDDEILICEGDLVGKTAEQITALIFHRDREFLQG